MIRVSLQKFTQTSNPSLLQTAAKQFGFWDMSKSRHKNSQETLKSIQLSQSPIDIKDSNTEFNKDLKVQFYYSPI
jgi:hypothetical protein